MHNVNLDEQEEEEEEEEEEVLAGNQKVDLYKCTKIGSCGMVYNVLREKQVTVTDKLTNKGNTALHVAVAITQHPYFLAYMLERAPENTKLGEVTNSDGHTLLHVAATIIGDTEAAKILLEREQALLFARDNKSHTPLALVVSNMQSEMSQFLLHHMKIAIHTESNVFSSISDDDELPSIVISLKEFNLALDLLKRKETVANDAELMALAQNFPRELNMFETYTETCALRITEGGFLRTTREYVAERWERLCGCCALRKLVYFFMGIPFIFIFLPLLLIKMLASTFVKKRVQVHEDAIRLLERVCSLILQSTAALLSNKDKLLFSTSGPIYSRYFMKPIFEATRQNAYELVHIIACHHSSLIWIVNEDGHNTMQYAVINRSEKVYNVLYQRKKYRNIFRTMKDSSGNNLLHLAARLAPTAKLNRISGAALQIQHELQWFKEVERYISPLHITQKNSFNETPQMVFTRENKDLVIEGEKWLKAAAESYTITAALITTVVFAAAITVPGGSNQDTGTPVFTHNNAFKIFALFDAISLFTSVTSLLMFLSILTTRFAEHDFLFKLPTKLIIGLTTLFISTTAMIIAFGATLYLVFCNGNSRLLIPIAMLTCLPITSFVTLQIPFIIELISSTYGRSIFRKQIVDRML